VPAGEGPLGHCALPQGPEQGLPVVGQTLGTTGGTPGAAGAVKPGGKIGGAVEPTGQL
jgi:hypothetical protein